MAYSVVGHQAGLAGSTSQQFVFESDKKTRFASAASGAAINVAMDVTATGVHGQAIEKFRMKAEATAASAIKDVGAPVLSERDVKQNVAAGPNSNVPNPNLQKPVLKRHPSAPKAVTCATVSALVDQYLKAWVENPNNIELSEFDVKNAAMAINVDRVLHTMDKFSTAFNKGCKPEHFGFISKLDLPAGSHVFVRADLHGDLKSLLENLRELQKQGLLDENYKCQKGVYLVFCGDYVDRGGYCVQILELLAVLKLENPNHVVLIRGNHEDSKAFNLVNGTKSMVEFLKAHDKGQIDRFYQSMPLSVYISQNLPNDDVRQYVQFTHGTMDLMIDTAILLDHKGPSASIFVPKAWNFSKRILRLVDANIQQNVTEYQITHEKDKARRQMLKQLYAATEIYEIVSEHLQIHGRDEMHNCYSWGDVTNETGLSKRGASILDLSAYHIRQGFRLCSEKHKVKFMIRGHEHFHSFGYHPVTHKLVVATLPVGSNSMAGFGDNWDGAYILKTSAKVKDWTKTVVMRQRGTSGSYSSNTVLLRDNSFKFVGGTQANGSASS